MEHNNVDPLRIKYLALRFSSRFRVEPGCCGNCCHHSSRILDISITTMKVEITWADDPGWAGAYTRQQAKGAMPNGTKVRKVRSQPKDGHQDGAMGTVIGSFTATEPMEVEGCIVRTFYFIEWEDMPKIGVCSAEHRIEAILN